MTAVQRLFLVIYALGAITLAAQTTGTTKKTAQTPMPTPSPKVVPVEPATVQVAPTTEPVTAQVSADTDKDLTDPRALKLSLDDALKTSMERNVGIAIQRFDYLESGQSLRSSYGIFDWFSTADI